MSVQLEVGKSYITRAGYRVWCIGFVKSAQGAHEDWMVVNHAPPGDYLSLCNHSRSGELLYINNCGLMYTPWSRQHPEKAFGSAGSYEGTLNSLKMLRAWYGKNVHEYGEDIVAEWTDEE